ncbi:hypothetical protein ACEPPN_012347 [Leptodophora sp. 'Broadleaf-Isolate-01']
MKTAQLGVLASLGIGVFVANGQGSGWDIKRQPWGPSTQKWSESAQWSEQWTWTADQQLPAAPGSAWQFSQSSTVAPPLPLGASSGGKWTWIPSPSSQGGFFWSYSSSSSPPSSSQGLGIAPGTPWQFSQSNTTPPPLPAGQSVGSWKWISGPSGGYYWSFIPGPKQDLPTPPGTAWQFSQSSTVAPPLPAGATSGSWKWISAPSGAGYYWSFIAGRKQNLPPPPGTEWIFSTSSTTAPPLPAGVSGAGTWKWVSSPDGKGYYWSFISSGGQTTPQQKLPDPPTGGSGWIFSTSSTVPPALPAGVSGAGSWKWVSSPDGKGYYWSYISSPGTQVPVQKLPELPTGGSGWIFSTSSTTPPPLPAGVSGAGSWKWVSSPDGNGYYWSYISSPGTQVPAQKLPEPPTGGSGWIFSTSSTVPPALPAGVSGTVSWQWVSSPDGKGYYWSFIPSPQSPQQQLPQPSSGSTEWIFSPSKTTPPSLPPGISGTAGSWRWVSSPSGEGYYWSFTPSYQPTQQLPTPKPGSSGWIFSESKTEPPKISGITGPGSWTWISNGSGQGYYWTWTPGAPQGVPSGFQGGVVTPGSGESGSIKGPFEGSFDQTGKPIDTTGGNIPSEIPGHLSTGDQPGIKPGDQPFEGSFDQTGKLVEQGGSTSGSHSTGAVPVQQPGATGELPTHEIPQTDGTGFIPGSGDAGVIKGPFEGSFDHTGKPVDTQPIQGGGSTEGSHSSGGVPVQQPGTTGETPLNSGTGGTGSVPGPGDADFLKGPFGNLFDLTGKPIDTQPIQGGGSTEGSHSSGGVPVQQPGTTGETPVNPQTSGEGSVPSSGSEDDIVRGPFEGFFDKTGKPLDSGSQGTYKCPPRSRIELLDAPTVPEAVCPNSQDRRYSAGGGKDFYILCCRHVDGGKKEIAVIPNIPSLQYCIHICAGTANCKSVLYTARQGYKSNYPLKSCQLFEHGNYGIQTPCNNDAHDSAYLIEPPTGTTGDIPPPPIAVDPPISPPPQVDIPPSFIMLPPGISEQCAQNVLAAIKCGTCASC